MLSKTASPLLPTLALAIAATLSLGACTPTAGPNAGAAIGASAVPVASASVDVSRTSACGREIGTFVDLLDRDLATGFVSPRVHEAATRELAPAIAACRAGDEGRARATLRAVRTRHGYPA